MRGLGFLLGLTIVVTTSTALGDEREAVRTATLEDDAGQSHTAAEVMTEPGPVLMVLADGSPFSKRYLEVLVDESATLRTVWNVRTLIITEALTPAQRPALDDLVTSRSWPFEIYFDANQALLAPFEVRGLPTTLLWSDDREILWKAGGTIPAEGLRGVLDEHLPRVGRFPFDATNLDDIAALIGSSSDFMRERCGTPLKENGTQLIYKGFAPIIDEATTIIRGVFILPDFTGKIPAGFHLGASMTDVAGKLGAPVPVGAFGRELRRSTFPASPGIEFVHDQGGTVRSLVILPEYLTPVDLEIPAEKIIDSACTPESWGGVSGDFIIRMLGRDRSHYLPVAWLERLRGSTPFVVQERPWHGVYPEDGLAVHMTDHEILRVDLYNDFETNGMTVEAFGRRLPFGLEFEMPIDDAVSALERHYAARPRGKHEDPDGSIILTYTFTVAGHDVPYFVALGSHRAHRTLSGVTVAIAPESVAEVKETDPWCQSLNWAIGRSAENYKGAGGAYRKNAAGEEMKGLVDVREVTRPLPGAIEGSFKVMKGFISDEWIEYVFYDGHDKHAARAVFDDIKAKIEGCDVCGFQIIEGVAESDRDQSRPDEFIMNWRLDRYRFKPLISEPRDVVLDMEMEFRTLLDSMRRYRVTLRIGAEL